MDTALPSNVRISTHPCLQAKLSQLRSASLSAKETKTLLHEVSIILSVEALASATKAVDIGKDISPLGVEYATQSITPSRLALVPILRTGLGMVDAIQLILPHSVPVYHLGFYRDSATLNPVEYYRNLFSPASSSPALESPGIPEVAIILDPVIATGGTVTAAVQLLKQWGVRKVIVIAVLGAAEGLMRVSKEWESCIEIFVGAVDQRYNEKGMVLPGTGDLGDRMWLTIKTK